MCFCCLSRFCIQCVDALRTAEVPGHPGRRLSERCPVCRSAVAKDDREAVEQLQAGVARCNPDAQSALGDHYRRGRGREGR